MTHALINVFSQLAIGGNQYVSYVSKIVIIVMAIVISSRGQKQKRDWCVVYEKIQNPWIYQTQYLSQPMVEFDNSTYSSCTGTEKDCKV